MIIVLCSNMNVNGFSVSLPSSSLFSLDTAAATTSKSPLSSLSLHNNNRRQWTSSLAVTTTDIEEDETSTSTSLLNDKGLYKRERYIATNRFSVRKASAGKFEKRWATRKSKLSILQGFRYFHLMRRVTINNNNKMLQYDEGMDSNTSFENYISFTIWDKKSDFSAWKNGEAFIEAHGGTSITAFVSTMVSSLLVLRGAPKPAFYDSLFMKSRQQLQQQPGTIVDGWRNDIQDIADGIQTLPAESFIIMTKYYIPDNEKTAIEFEKTLQSYQVINNNNNNVVASTLMRRDGQAKGYVLLHVYIFFNVLNDMILFDMHFLFYYFCWIRHSTAGVALCV